MGEGEVELLAWVLGDAQRQRAAAVLDAFGGLARLGRADPAEVAAQGLGEADVRRLRAALDLGRRALLPPSDEVAVVEDAVQAEAILGPRLRGRSVEELHALYLDRRRRVLDVRVLTVGSARFTVVDPPHVYRPAVSLGATAVILGHNHPSGDPTPSVQDFEVTRRVARAGDALGVTLLDHLVVGDDRWVSLAAEGALGPAVPLAAGWTA